MKIYGTWLYRNLIHFYDMNKHEQSSWLFVPLVPHHLIVGPAEHTQPALGALRQEPPCIQVLKKEHIKLKFIISFPTSITSPSQNVVPYQLQSKSINQYYKYTKVSCTFPPAGVPPYQGVSLLHLAGPCCGDPPVGADPQVLPSPQHLCDCPITDSAPLMLTILTT